MPIVGIPIIFLGFYTVYRYYKNTPKFRVDGNFISFNSLTYALSDIQKVTLTGKQGFPYIVSFPMEAATIYFNTGEQQVIFDDMYENAWELKHFLKQVVIDKKQFSISEKPFIDEVQFSNASFDTYKDNQLFSFRGLSMWALVAVVLFAILANLEKATAGLIIFLTTFSTFWIMIHAWFMHYFQVSDKFFVVRSHVYFWKKKIYQLNDIREIVFETQGRMPNCLRVITNNFKSKLYPAGTLRDKTWLELKKSLNAAKIKVRNECVQDNFPDIF